MNFVHCLHPKDAEKCLMSQPGGRLNWPGSFLRKIQRVEAEDILHQPALPEILPALRNMGRLARGLNGHS